MGRWAAQEGTRLVGAVGWVDGIGKRRGGDGRASSQGSTARVRKGSANDTKRERERREMGREGGWVLNWRFLIEGKTKGTKGYLETG